jgi:molybdate transport system substrate-binding protein
VFKRSLLILLAVLILGAAQIPSFAQVTLKVAAAADLQPVLPALIDQFESQTHEKVEASYASSSTLATQILNGGPFGLFLSADLSFPQKVAAAGLAESAEPVPYARGTLVLWARNDSPVQPLSIDSLRSPSLRTVAVANAEHAPYGRAAKAAIEKLGFTESLKGKLVVAENIAQAAQYADSGNADAGLISLTSALSPRLSADGKYIAMPDDSYPPLLQGAIVLKGSNVAQAHQFLDFLLSPPIRKQLAERGLKAP